MSKRKYEKRTYSDVGENILVGRPISDKELESFIVDLSRSGPDVLLAHC